MQTGIEDLSAEECVRRNHSCSGIVRCDGKTLLCECACHQDLDRWLSKVEQRQQLKVVKVSTVSSVERTWRLAEAGHSRDNLTSLVEPSPPTNDTEGGITLTDELGTLAGKTAVKTHPQTV
jgi:hypothetical protein